MSALIDLACAFPPRVGLHGAKTTIEDVSHMGCMWVWRDRLFAQDKYDAVRLIWRASEERCRSSGAGNKAKRRAANLAK